MHFTKMHGLGNDYLYVNGEVPANICELSTQLSDRHFGVGSDGMIYISPSQVADFQMRVFNADGSEGMMCGNGIRCVGKYVYDKGYTDKTTLTIETLSGIKTLRLNVLSGKVKTVSVDMGKAEAGKDIRLDLNGTKLFCTPVNVGNPHAVIFVSAAEEVPVAEVGPVIEKDAAFPGGVNVEFVQVISPSELRMKVWERGSGITMACGTGACASVAAAISKGYCKFRTPVSVQLDGGILEISIDEDHNVVMNGPATTVFEGEVEE